MAASVMVWLGQWQLDRARENGDEKQKQKKQKQQEQEQARSFTAAGTWDTAHQPLVADRRDTA